jgi:Tol biopolymer transport system component
MVKQELWLKSLDGTNDEKLTEVVGGSPFCPRWSPDSKSIAFSRLVPASPEGTKKTASIVLFDIDGRAERPLTSQPERGMEPWRDYVYDWSPDGQWLIGSTDRQTPQRWLIARFPVADAPRAERGMQVLVKDPEADLWAPRVSPDGRWVCYLRQTVVEGTTSSVIHVARVSGGETAAVTSDNFWADKPRWSPDGKTIYFVSNQNSYFLNVWGIKFDPASGRAVGEPFRVSDIGSPSMLISSRLSFMEMALSETRLALPITEVSGNIWIMENLER